MRTQYFINILNHNYNPGQILESLSAQVTLQSENIHIILWDDGSNEKYTYILSELQTRFDYPFIKWKRSQENRGRTAMRQKILKSNPAGWMISIDSDMIPDPDFISQIVTTLRDPGIVYTGCHYYQDNTPEAPFLLHWHYGKKREVPAQSKNAYLHFSTGIYALHSSLAEKLHFDKSMQTYGHEDTLFGLLLQEKNIPVQPTKLTALHAGLSSTDEFIAKQLESVRNLQIVLTKYPAYKSGLVRWAERLNKIPGIKQLIKSEILHHFCVKSLHKKPGLIVFLDLLKLHERLKDLD